MSKTPLIVDDSTPLRQVVAIILKSQGFDVIAGCDGKDALTKLDGRKVSLIVSDLNIPNMDDKLKAWMVKPFKLEQMLAAVNKLLA